MTVKMAFIKHVSGHYEKSDYLRICQAISTIFLLSLRGIAMTVANEGEVTLQMKNSNNSQLPLYANPPGIKIEPNVLPHPRVLTGTKEYSRTITTSTVRPWPSHSFFRSVLANSDNVAATRSGRKTSRPNFTLGDHNNETGLQDKGTSSLLKRLVKSRKRNKYQTADNDAKVPIEIYQARKRTSQKGLNIANETEELSESSVNLRDFTLENVTQASGDIDKARSVPKAMRKATSTKGNSNYNTVNSERKVKNAMIAQEEMDVNSQFEIMQNENVSSRHIQPTLNESNKMDQYSQLNGWQVGFQYEIAAPTTSRLPSASSTSSPNASTSFLHIPSTTAVSTTFQVSLNSSGKPNKSDTTSPISTSSAVSTTSANGASEKAPTPLPLSPLYYEMKGVETTSDRPGFPTTHSFFFHNESNKSNESLYYHQSPPPPPPTQTSQLNVYSDEEHNSQRPSSQTYPAQSGNEIHKIKGTKEPSSSTSPMSSVKINHNFGNFAATPPEREFTTVAPSPTLKLERTREGNPSSTNDLTLKIALRNRTSVPHPQYHDPTSHLWNASQPTHFSQTMTVENMSTFHSKGGLPIPNRKHTRSGSKTSTLIKRKNMFTVINNVKKGPSIHVESRNGTKSNKTPVGKDYLSATNFHDRINQVERPPSVTTAILAGPDLSGSNYVDVEGKDRDYFDEDDAQTKLHHWIESEQGHSISGSTELPRFTNLTWPYNFVENGSSATSVKPTTNSTYQGGVIIGSSNVGIPEPSLPSTALSVSFSSQQREEKVPSTGFNSRYEFYVPSAAADPHQNPILVAKPSAPNKSEVPLESWSLVSTLQSFTTDSHHPPPLETDLSHLKQGESDPKTKVKHSHWGSKGLSIKQEKPQTKQPLYPSSAPPPSKKKRPDRPQENIKVYESSTGNPKSTPSTYFPNLPISSSTTFSTFAGGKHGNHFSTFHVPTPSATWPILGGVIGGAGDQTEMASFVTAKTPTNIWYKPIINHFTATVPINGTTTMFYDALLKSTKNPVSSHMTTPIPFVSSTLPAEYVGEDEHDSGNKKDTTFYPSHSSNEPSSQVLFNVWKLVDGKLTLQTQKEIPSWALQGYTIPAAGTVLNLQQIPPAVQPLVTSAMGKEAEAYGDGKVYVWQKLPLIGSPGTVSNAPLEPLPGNERNPQKIISSSGNSGWSPNDSANSKRPISINYVLWNNPAWASNSQSIILSPSTPSPPHQFLLSHKPTPVSYFPSSTIRLEEEYQQQPTTPFSMVVRVKRPHAHSYLTTASNFPPTTPTTIIPTAATVSNEELELLFQNYFQYVRTTPTPPASYTPTRTAVIKEPMLGEIGSHKVNMTSSKAWSDLKKLILRLAANKNRQKIGDKTSITQENKTGEYLDHLGNVAAISIIMDYLQSQEGSKDSILSTTQQQTSSLSITRTTTKPPSSSSLAPFGVTDDMTPPHKDQLWATTYPLFQHMLNNPNYTFIPPPLKAVSSNPQSLSGYALSSSPTQFSTPIPFTEPPTGEEGTTLSSANDYYTNYNHYASYPTGPASSITRAPYTIGSQVYITEVPKHGATTEKIPRSDIDKLGELGYGDDPAKTLLLPVPPQNLLALLLLHKLLDKKKGGGKGGGKSKKKKKLASVGAAAVAGVAGATLLKKIAHVVKQPSKYWLDLKFDIDFYDLIKKQLLYWLAYRYMPVFIVLAFGLIPVTLSLVPLIYKVIWQRNKKPKYIKVPVPVPKPYPVPVYKHPEPPPHPYPYYPETPYGYDNHDGQFHGYSPPADEHSLHNPDPDLPYEYEAHDHDDQHHHQHNHNEDDDDEDTVIHIGSQLPSSPIALDHYSAGNDDGHGFGEAQEDNRHSPHSYKTRLNRHRDDNRKGKVNSFNYNEDYDPSHSTSYSHSRDAFYRYPPTYHNGKPGEGDQEIHVHLHDEETQQVPQYQQYQQKAPVTFPPSFKYTSYNSEDLQPYPVTKSYEMGFDLGQMINKITNKQDMEIFKILIENKKEKINKLLEMWKLAKYGVGVASSAATNLAGNLAGIAGAATAGMGSEAVRTPLDAPKGQFGKRGRRRGRRRKKRKPLTENFIHTNRNSTSNSEHVDNGN